MDEELKNELLSYGVAHKFAGRLRKDSTRAEGQTLCDELKGMFAEAGGKGWTWEVVDSRLYQRGWKVTKIQML